MMVKYSDLAEQEKKHFINLSHLIVKNPKRDLDILKWRDEGRTFIEIGRALGIGRNAARTAYLQTIRRIERVRKTTTWPK
jgi:hypothetical protein